MIEEKNYPLAQKSREMELIESIEQKTKRIQELLYSRELKKKNAAMNQKLKNYNILKENVKILQQNSQTLM
jgi:predicted SAM-dependent methyltransferase